MKKHSQEQKQSSINPLTQILFNVLSDALNEAETQSISTPTLRRMYEAIEAAQNVGIKKTD